MRYLAHIDGLRGVAILLVVAFHAFPGLAPGGYVGVDVFFVVSGYLITRILLTSESGLVDFYVRRARRLFPALFVVCAACLAWGWVALDASAYAALGKHSAAGAGFVANLVLWSEAGYFDAEAHSKPLLHLWSLGIEEQFYLAWPFLLALVPRRRVAVVAGLVTVASFAACVVITEFSPSAAFYDPLTRIWELSAGAVLGAGWKVDLTGIRRDGLALAGLAAVVASTFVLSAGDSFPGWRALLPVAGTLAVLVAGPQALPCRSWLSARWIVAVGLISYPLYLWHWPLLVFAERHLAAVPSVGVRLLLLGVSGVLAWLTVRFVERPIRTSAPARGPVVAIAGGMAAVAGFGLWTWTSGGLPERPANQGDAATYLAYYQQLRRRLTVEFRAECDLMDWRTEKMASTLPPHCTAPGARRTVFLWGDSHAQSLVPGLMAILPEDEALAQVNTSGCAPDLPRYSKFDRCSAPNTYALERIEQLRPELVVLAQADDHAEADWPGLTERLTELGVGRVVVVGPAPVWRPSLPRVVAKHLWEQPHDWVHIGLEAERGEIDRHLAEDLAALADVTHVSLWDGLCDERGCRATVPGLDGRLMTLDAGHLTPEGSVWIAEEVLRAAVLAEP